MSKIFGITANVLKFQSYVEKIHNFTSDSYQILSSLLQMGARTIRTGNCPGIADKVMLLWNLELAMK